jgi:hypothetical protein
MKAFLNARSLSAQYIEETSSYLIKAADGYFALETSILKDGSEADDQSDFETNYKPLGNKKLDTKDSDGTILQRAKVTTTGWHYQLQGLEFETSNLSSIYSKKADGTDFGFSTIKCYDVNNNELVTQETCDSSAIKTIIDWEPSYDYEIIGGLFKQATLPATNVRLWVVGVPDVPEQNGGSKLFVANINLKFVGLEDGIKVDGRAPKYMAYNATYHTSKLRMVLKHEAGIKHPLNVVFELFKA